ncbi:DeoR/GlpR family DNA-binding transcription regulator [Microbacterium gorillae]|uniref:DeoR/GlpR family DNA-binding transcription regulator n=1 Tax=Microbacterium gorillae TaxID=1231063 RepID=UPI00058C2D57|nr:DeoR/GlpR family DNA-binding transcription regulator [Microbacterium gorillae]
MNRSARHAAILELLADSGRVEVEDIVAQLGVSPATARRDLDALAERQLLSRTHGGAVAHSVAYDLPLRYKRSQHADAKDAIARAASGMVPRGATVGICGGTTTTALAEALTMRADVQEASAEPGLTMVTNSVNIAMGLAPREQIKTVLTGGVLHPRSYEAVGNFADAVLNAMTLDFAFIGVVGIDPVLGATGHDEREAVVNRAMATRAQTAVIVADSSKIGERAFAVIGGPELFHTVITDSGATVEQVSSLEAAGYRVIVAE